jgi:hypothetical protein
VRIVVSARAVETIHRRGGRLYVWPKKSGCCGGNITLMAATSPPSHKAFRCEDRSASFELYLPTHLAPLPDEVHIDARGRPDRIQAYWNGCAWVV